MVNVQLEFNVMNAKVSSQTIKRLIGIDEWSPPDKPQIKYLFPKTEKVAYVTAEWARSVMSKVTYSLPEGTKLWVEFSTGSWKHVYASFTGVLKVREGARFESDALKAINAEVVVSADDTEKLKIGADFCEKHDYQISSSKRIQNLIAAYLRAIGDPVEEEEYERVRDRARLITGPRLV